jgi:hypothetical protein
MKPQQHKGKNDKPNKPKLDYKTQKAIPEGYEATGEVLHLSGGKIATEIRKVGEKPKPNKPKKHYYRPNKKERLAMDAVDRADMRRDYENRVPGLDHKPPKEASFFKSVKCFFWRLWRIVKKFFKS